jgi:hypothetical protein
MPGVEWGDTTTYSRDELRMAVEHKLRRREVRVRVLGKHRYYHQTYSFLKLSLADA